MSASTHSHAVDLHKAHRAHWTGYTSPFFGTPAAFQGHKMSILAGKGDPHDQGSVHACREQEELFAGLNCQPGFVCTRSELSQDLRTLLQSGLFANVDARVAHRGKGKYTLNFTFSENLWQPIQSFKVCKGCPPRGFRRAQTCSLFLSSNPSLCSLVKLPGSRHPFHAAQGGPSPFLANPPAWGWQ